MIFLYHFRKYSDDNEALSRRFDFGITYLFPFGDTRYKSNPLMGSNTCTNNIIISISTKRHHFFAFLHTGTIRHVKEMWNNIMEKVAGKVLNPIKFIALLNLYQRFIYLLSHLYTYIGICRLYM